MKSIILFFIITLPLSIFAQGVTLSGKIEITENAQKVSLAYANVLLKTAKDSAFVSGTITNELGAFSFSELKQLMNKTTRPIIKEGINIDLLVFVLI